MRILIIEDDPNKLAILRIFLTDTYEDAEIGVAMSYNTGLQKILSEEWTVVLLDMQLPTFDKTPSEPGGRQRAFAGQQILRRMVRDRLDTPVIVVTQFERFGDGADVMLLVELIAMLEQGDYPNYAGTIYYNADLSEWKRILKRTLDKILLGKGT